MRYLLDTNIVSYLYDPQSPPHSKIKPHIQEGHSYYLSILTLFEMEYSLANTPESKNSRVSNSIANMKKEFIILPLTENASTIFGKLKKSLKDKRNITNRNLRKHNIDIMLASTALSENLILVSADDLYPALTEFDPQLTIENWII